MPTGDIEPRMQRSGNVLVVDDEEVICDTLRFYLESEGFDVRTVHSGRDALARLAAGDVEVLILDILMPQMNGLEVMHWIAERSLPVEVIVTTGAGSHDIGVEALRLGASTLLRKPILNLDEKLLPAVRQAAQRYRLKADLREKTQRAEELERALNELLHFETRILRAADDAALLAVAGEATRFFLGEATFLLFRAEPPGSFRAVGRADIEPLACEASTHLACNRRCSNACLPPHVACFPLTVNERKVGLFMVGSLPKVDSTELMPLLALLPAVACSLLARGGESS
jgi:FixJ family two-component response regulator